MAATLDFTTLYFCNSATAVGTATAMYYVWRAYRRDAAVRYWFFGYAMWASSAFLVAFRDVMPPVFGRVIGNLAGVGCIALIYFGTSRFLGRSPAWRLLLPFYLPTALAFVYWGLIENSIIHRVTPYSVCVTLTLALMVRDLWSTGSGPLRATQRLVAVAFAAGALVTVLRMVYLLQGAEASPLHVAMPQTIWFVVTNLTNLISCLGLVLMVSQRLQEKNNWARIEELFHETLRLPAERRMAHLQEICDGDEQLYTELHSLVKAAESPDPGLEGLRALSSPGAAAAALTLGSGSRLGEYRIQRLIGQGGMGEVYLAETAGEAPVAIKLLRTQAVEHEERFQAEQRIVARLLHPAIARVHGGGFAEDGRPYMVMDYVPGEPITDYCRHWRLPLRQRLELFRQVCEAVRYAHANLVVHRDLKPSNILVSEDGRVRLLDFGVAKQLSPLSQGDATVTQLTPFTPEYAAPEQFEGRGTGVATDVYALGMLLFELLTDELPWRLKSLPASVALQKVLHEDAQAPSEAAAARQAPPVLPRLLRDDLDAIVAKSLRKSPKDRYASVAALTDDLDRYREGGIVGARGIRWGGWRHPRARRWAAAAAMLVLLAATFQLGLSMGAPPP